MTRFWSVYYQFMMLQLKLIFLWLFYPVIFKLFAISSIIYVLGQPKKWKSWLCSDLTGYIAAALIPVVFLLIFDHINPVENNVNEYVRFIGFMITSVLFGSAELAVCYAPARFREGIKISEYFKLRLSIQYLFYIFILLLYLMFIVFSVAEFFRAEELKELLKNKLMIFMIFPCPILALIFCFERSFQSWISYYQEETENRKGVWNGLKFVFNLISLILCSVELSVFLCLFSMRVWFIFFLN